MPIHLPESPFLKLYVSIAGTLGVIAAAVADAVVDGSEQAAIFAAIVGTIAVYKARNTPAA